MVLQLDKYLVKGFNPKFENILEGKPSIGLLQEIIPEKFLREMGFTTREIYFGKPTPYHYHKKTKEVFIFHNEGTVILEDVQFNVNHKDVLYIPQKMKHKLIPLPNPEYPNSYLNLITTIYTIPFFDPSDEYIIKE